MLLSLIIYTLAKHTSYSKVISTNNARLKTSFHCKQYVALRGGHESLK